MTRRDVITGLGVTSPVDSSSAKFFSNLMGATGADEFMSAVSALQNQAIPPTLNLT